jgi:hypothetical protein
MHYLDDTVLSWFSFAVHWPYACNLPCIGTVETLVSYFDIGQRNTRVCINTFCINTLLICSLRVAEQDCVRIRWGKSPANNLRDLSAR